MLSQPDAMVTASTLQAVADGDVAFVLTRDGLEVRRRAELYGSDS